MNVIPYSETQYHRGDTGIDPIEPPSTQSFLEQDVADLNERLKNGLKLRYVFLDSSPSNFSSADTPFSDKRCDAMGWREYSLSGSVRGWDNKSEDIAQCLINAPWVYYHWFVIAILDTLPISEHKRLWRNISQTLRRQGVIGWCNRELSKDGQRIHYNLITKTDNPPKQLKATIKGILSGVKHNVCHKPIPDNFEDRNKIIRYIAKTKWYRDKRVYFKKRLGLNAIITIGDFWEGQQKELLLQWKDKKRQWAKNHNQAIKQSRAMRQDRIEEQEQERQAMTRIKQDRIRKNTHKHNETNGVNTV